jgi:hypothetical protein
MSKAQRSSIWKPSCRVARSMPSISTVRDGPIAVEGCGDRCGNGRSQCRRDRPADAQPARADGHGRAARCRDGAVHVARRRRGSGGRNLAAPRANSIPRWSRDHRATGREFRSDSLSRPVSRGLTSGDRDQDEGSPHQTPRGHHTATGDRSDGSAEAQSRTGNGRLEKFDPPGAFWR